MSNTAAELFDAPEFFGHHISSPPPSFDSVNAESGVYSDGGRLELIVDDADARITEVGSGAVHLTIIQGGLADTTPKPATHTYSEKVQAHRDAMQAAALRAQAGDTAAYAELYAGSSNILYKLALQITGESETAADVVQTVFELAFKNIHNFEGRAHILTWLQRITHNESVDFVRRRRRIPVVALSGVGDGVNESQLLRSGTSHSDDPEKIAIQNTDLYEALHELPLRTQRVVYMRYVLGVSIEETAQATGISPANVKNISHRGLRSLREILNGERIKNRVDMPETDQINPKAITKELPIGLAGRLATVEDTIKTLVVAGDKIALAVDHVLSGKSIKEAATLVGLHERQIRKRLSGLINDAIEIEKKQGTVFSMSDTDGRVGAKANDLEREKMYELVSDDESDGVMRAILDRVFNDQASYEAISNEFGIRAATIQKRIVRLRRRAASKL